MNRAWVMTHAWLRREDELVSIDAYARAQLADAQNRLERNVRFRQSIDSAFAIHDTDRLACIVRQYQRLIDTNRKALYWHRNAHAFCVLKVLQARHWSALPDAICREIVKFL